MTVPALILALSLASWPTPAPPLCDRPAPSPVSFHSRGFNFVAEVFPPNSRHNRGSSTRIYAYDVGYPGTEWEVDATPRWTAALPDGAFPQQAVVSVQGHMVTLDDYGEYDGGNAVLVLDQSGKQISGYHLSELMTEAELSETERSDCGFHWRKGASYFFLLAERPRLYVVLERGLVFAFDLETGDLARGSREGFPELDSVMENPFANEEVEVWATSLRFSSITDSRPRG